MLEDVSEARSRRRPERWFSGYRRMKPGQARDVTATSAAASEAAAEDPLVLEDVSEARSREKAGAVVLRV